MIAQIMRALLFGAALAIAHTWKAAGSDGDEPKPKPTPNPCAKGHIGPFILSGTFRTGRTCGSTSMGH